MEEKLEAAQADRKNLLPFIVQEKKFILFIIKE